MSGCDSHKIISIKKGQTECVALNKGIHKHITVCGDYAAAVLPTSPENFLASNEIFNPFSVNNDGDDGAIRIPHSTDIDIQDEFTFECDVELNELGSNQNLYFQRQTSGGSGGVLFRPSSDGSILLILWNSSGGAFTHEFDAEIVDTDWHHIGLTISDTSFITLYLDKVAVDSVQAPESPTSVPEDIGITCSMTNSTIGGSYEMNVDNIRFWHVERTAQQIADNADVILEGNETGLMAYYKCDENGDPEDTLVDSAGDNDAVLSGGITYQQSVRFGSENITTFSWDAVAGVNGYNIYISVDEGAFVKHNGALITDLEYSIEELDSGDYQVYVTSENDEGESDPSNIESFTVS